MRLSVLALFLAAIPQAFAGNARAWEETLTLPTYLIHGSDFNPHFYDIEGAIIYPYSMQDDLGDERVDREYRAVYLENDYLKVICLPQIGGRIHSVFDKTSNHEMFHRNDVIKPGLIAMRGAWISGGIEWNRGPQGHTITSFSPVDVTSRENKDGSASLIVGYLEANFKTRWDVVLTLHPDKAYLHEEISLYNPTDGVHSYYFWNNTAFPCKPGTRFIYPMKLGQDHEGTSFFTWPMHNGKDITWLKNYDEPSSVFAYQCAFDFFGAYDVDDDRGIVQYGDHRVLTGKKAWTWGQSGDGLASQRALHEDDTQYIEVQSGPLQTQADYGLLGPRQKIAWEEWWYPVHGLGDGFEFATRDVAIQTMRPKGDNGEIEIRILSTGQYPNTIITVQRPTAAPTIKPVDLTPGSVTVLKVAAKHDERIIIDLRSGDGEELAHYSSPLEIPDRTPPAKPSEAAVSTVEELYLKGVKHEEAIQPGPAREAYEKALAADPGYCDALVAMARLELERANYASAAAHAQKATQRDPGNGMAWYYYGLAAMELPADQRTIDPIDAAYKVVASLDYPALGHDLAGRAYMRAKKYKEALSEFTAAVAQTPDDPRANNHLIAALYTTGNNKDANLRALVRSAINPLDFLPRAITSLPEPMKLRAFCDYLKQVSGRPDFEVISIAFFLIELGLYTDAYNVLTEFYNTPVPNITGVLYHGDFRDVRQRPGPWYILAWLSHQTNNDFRAEQCLARGRELVPHYQFPTNPRFADIYRYALSVNPDDGNAHLMLGNLLAYQGKLSEAVAEWEQATLAPKPYGVPFRNLAMHAWKKENDLPKASALFAKAIAAWPADQTLYRDAATVLIADNKRPEAITLLASMPLDHPRRGDITVLLANAYNDEKKYDDALQLLEQTKFSNWESNTASWRAFHLAHLERGKLRFDAKQFDTALEDFTASLTYPDFLGVGRSARPEESEAFYWKGKALEALNRKDEARAAWTEGAAGVNQSDKQKEYIALCKEALGAAQ
jgi:tetratricopeptide (TPR) repeat protein